MRKPCSHRAYNSRNSLTVERIRNTVYALWIVVEYCERSTQTQGKTLFCRGFKEIS